MCLHWHSTPAGLFILHTALYSFVLQFSGVNHGWVRVFSSLMGILLAVFIGISFMSTYSGSTLSVTVIMFGLPLLLVIYSEFLICAPSYILGLFCALVHHAFLM